MGMGMYIGTRTPDVSLTDIEQLFWGKKNTIFFSSTISSISQVLLFFTGTKPRHFYKLFNFFKAISSNLFLFFFVDTNSAAGKLSIQASILII